MDENAFSSGNRGRPGNDQMMQILELIEAAQQVYGKNVNGPLRPSMMDEDGPETDDDGACCPMCGGSGKR